MSRKLLLLVHVFVCCYGMFLNEDLVTPKSDLLHAADEIISRSFKPSAVTINFIISLSDETKRERSILINNLVARCDVVYVEEATVITHRQRLYNVIFIDTFKSFLRLSRQMSASTFVIDGYYLMIFVEGPIPEMAQITKLLWSIFIYNVDFLVEAETGLSLLTFLPFSETNCVDGKCEKRCGDSTPMELHSFKGNQSFVGNFYPDKMMNLYKCPIKVVTFNCPPMMMIQYDEDKKYTLKGIDGEMLKILAKQFNFEIDLIHISDEIRWGALYDNGTSTGAMEMVINADADFTLGMYTITYLRSTFMTASEFYYSVAFILIVPPGVPFTPFEKLFRPFQLTVWILLLLAFFTAASVITVVKFQSEEVKHFVFGANNKSPYLNILNVFVGVSMDAKLLPGRNFARSLLMMFLLFSIVKRTLYQGALFQFIQADDRHKETQTIDELVQKNFKVFMMASSLEHTKNMKFRKQRVVVNSTVLEHRKKETMDYKVKAAVSSSLEQVLYFNKMNYKNSTTLTVCKEPLFTFQYGIYYRKNSYLKDVFNKKISRLKSSALIDFWASDYISSKFLNIKTHDGSPKKLNIRQLMGGFEVVFIGFGVGTFVFICEIVSKCLRTKKLQKLIEFFT